MRNIILIMLFLFGLNAISQNQIYPTLASLSMQAGTSNVSVYVSCGATAGDGNGGVYIWNASSTATSDGIKTIAVTGVSTGRWLYQSLSPTNSVTLSGTIAQSTYTITHGFPFTPANILITPKSANAAVAYWISSITSTNFVINFASVPIVGTNNITIGITGIK